MTSDCHANRRVPLFRQAAVALAIGGVCVMGAAPGPLPQEQPDTPNTRASRNFRAPDNAGNPELRSSFATTSEAIRIGYFGPFATDPDPDVLEWLAAKMALEDLSGECLDGRPLKLVPAWSDSPWTGGAALLTDLIFEQQVVGIIGSIDGEATHLAETVVAKTHVPLLSPVSVTKSVNLANVPWTFSILPGDHLVAPTLAKHLADTACSLAVISGSDHDSRAFWQELRANLPAERITLLGLWTIQGAGREESQSLSIIAEKVMKAAPDCVLITANAVTAARAVLVLRGVGYSGGLATDARGGRRAFLETAGDSAEGIFCPLVVEPSNKLEDWFARFESRFQRKGDYAAAATYDATCLLFRATVRASSPQQMVADRASVVQALRGLSPYDGVTGRIEWDDLGANLRPAHLGVIRGGTVRPTDPAAAN